MIIGYHRGFTPYGPAAASFVCGARACWPAVAFQTSSHRFCGKPPSLGPVAFVVLLALPLCPSRFLL